VNILSYLYQFEIVKTLKNAVRPIKHRFFGKTGIYEVIDRVAIWSGGNDKVRTVLDIGAATGEYTIHFLRAYPNAIVYCFEPQLASYRRLQKRTKPYEERVRLFNYGLYSADGESTFFVAQYADASSLIDKGTGATEKTTIQLRALDGVMAELGVETIDFAKIDVEGAELAVLDGGKEYFSKNVMIAYVEIEPQILGHFSGKHLEVFAAMETMGFGFFGAIGSDYLFSKRRKVH
jgi:FkbM family methyltransferase